MLEFKLVQGSRLRNAVGPLQHIRGEAVVFCNSETLYLQASDIDRTIVALLRFRSGFFNRYVVNRKAMAGVGVLALGIILETTDDKDSIAVRANCHSNVIDFTFEDVAFVYVTASRVRFYTVGQEIVLTKEHGECIIGGVKEEDEQKTLLGILHRKISPILEASELCGTVWFLQSARRTNSPFPPPTMINCPIGLMANLNFHFVKE